MSDMLRYARWLNHAKNYGAGPAVVEVLQHYCKLTDVEVADIYEKFYKETNYVFPPNDQTQSRGD